MKNVKVNKKDCVRVLETIATYMEILGENPFKISAYRKAAASLEHTAASLEEIEDFTKLPNIGKGTAAVIEEYIKTGQAAFLEELKRDVPKGLIPLLQLPNLGSKRIAKLYKELQIENIHDLKKACLENKVQKLDGFGKKFEEKLLLAIEQFGTRPERFPIAIVLPIAEKIEEKLKLMEDVDKFSRAGSLRRVKETVKDIDYIIATENPSSVRDQIIKMEEINEVIASGDTKVSVVFNFETEVAVDFRLVRPEEFATALHHFTGSKEHNVKMRQLAKKHREKINEYGVEKLDSGELITFESEKQFFHHFGLPYIPPELRESGKEVEDFTDDYELISLSHIKGDLHMHTTWSDGAYSIEEMVEACRKRGYEFIAITDHSQYLKVANGLAPERLLEHHKVIKELNEKYDDILILSGTEMDILPDGTLDYGDEVLEQLDFVIASIHSAFSQPEEKIMYRLEKAMKNPYVDMIAHPTGKLIGRRNGYDVDMDKLIQLAKETNTILELNANPNRLDLAPQFLRKAQEAGVKIAINTDAHNIDTLDYMKIGVSTAMKGWIHPSTVINTFKKEEILHFLQRKKRI